jgi:murein DD-endopeptidase MepM/ murein hydrolase activator NlpD
MSYAHVPFDFSVFKFGPVIELPDHYEVYDFTKGYDPNRARESEYGVGRYNEKRTGMYVTELFTLDSAETRNIHIGVDLAAPVGTAVKAFADGSIFLTGINSADGDYGGTIITEHQLGERTIWALHGHLSHNSTVLRAAGEILHRGDVIGWLGDKSENGGWNAHVHFQLSWKKPDVCDMPGAVTERDLEEALQNYPDPRLVLGPLWK